MLWRMYHSDELLNEGIQSFEYALYGASDEELDLFLGKLVRGIGRAARNVGRAIGSAAKAVGKGVNAITKVIPFDTLTSALALTPMGMAVRAGLGAVTAVANGKNAFQGAFRTLASNPIGRFAVDTASGVARGDNVLKSIGRAGQAGIGDLKESLRFAAMVAPFVPGIGTGVAVALGAANALASGERITDALIAAARNAIPGGALAQSGFDIAANVIKGQNLSDAALGALRSQLPPGPSRAAFDTGLAVAKGQKIQDALLAGGAQLLPKSPYSADIASFVKRAAAGENLGKAALSTAGNLAMKRIERQVGPILSRVQPRLPIRRRGVPKLPMSGGYPFFQRELAAPAAAVAMGGSRGVWVRHGDRIIVDLNPSQPGLGSSARA